MPQENTRRAAAQVRIDGASAVAEAATRYIEAGIAVTPVRFGTKAAVFDDWKVRPVTLDDVPRLFRKNGYSIGAVLGARSNGLTDVDLDCPEAIALAQYFLPATGARFGRNSARNSHWLYRSDLHESEGDRSAILCPDPETEKGKMLVELRIGAGNGGAQTVMPPSRHEEGEPIEWEPGCGIEQIAPAEGADLKTRSMRLMAATLLTRCWLEGARNGATNALAGWLARLKWSEDETASFVKAIATVAGDDEIPMRVRAVHDTYKKFEAGKKVTGRPRLKELFGGKTIGKAAEFLSTIGSTQFPDTTKDGGPRATLPNTKVALMLLDIECRYDLFTLKYLVDGHEIESYVGEISDPVLLRLRELIHEKFRFDPNTQVVDTAVRTLANHRRFHPVLDYLDAISWDGVARIDQWLVNYGGAEDTPYTRAVGALVLVAAVRRVRQPGCKFDEMLVLENPDQGTNKSQALQTLAVRPEWFTDNLPLGLSAKETIETLSGHWIVEASELQGMRKSDVERVKAFLSRDTDRARMAFDRNVTDARRQCVIIGTTNSEQYLRDPSGNRRYWPVRIKRFDIEALLLDRDQLWAEAAAREMKGASIRLPEELWPEAAREQQQREIENPFVSVLESTLEQDSKPMEGKIANEDVWNILKLPPKQRQQYHFELLGKAMKELGWERIRLRTGGKRSYHYVRGEPPHRHISVMLLDDKDGTPSRATASYDDDVPSLF